MQRYEYFPHIRGQKTEVGLWGRKVKQEGERKQIVLPTGHVEEGNGGEENWGDLRGSYLLWVSVDYIWMFKYKQIMLRMLIVLFLLVHNLQGHSWMKRGMAQQFPLDGQSCYLGFDFGKLAWTEAENIIMGLRGKERYSVDF